MEANTGYEAAKLAPEYSAEYVTDRYDLSMAGMRLFSVDRGDGGRD